jgi:L-asparaginase
MGIDFYVYAFNPPIDSSDMQPEIWVELASIIEDRYDRYDGFVILHGSDTMSFTASALSFMLENLSKPVILTGSQLPIGKIRTDAKENIITAMEIASTRHNGQVVVPEVCIYFDFALFRGNRSKKYNAEKFEAFYSMNYPPLAEAGIDIKYKTQFVLPAPVKPLKVHKQLDDNVTVLKMYPGITRKAVEAILSVPGLRGVVLEAFGSGNTNTQPWFTESLKKVIDKGVLVVDITQCDGGSVELGKYETSQPLQQIGVISGHDMTFEAAITKLMFVLGQGLDPEATRSMIETSLRGELTPFNHDWE